jgi:hypothetical protein
MKRSPQMQAERFQLKMLLEETNWPKPYTEWRKKKETN